MIVGSHSRKEAVHPADRSLDHQAGDGGWTTASLCSIGFCKALRDQGLPLWRMSVVTNALDPSVRGLSFDWHSDRGASLASASYGDEDFGAFERSLLHAVLADGRTSPDGV